LMKALANLPQPAGRNNDLLELHEHKARRCKLPISPVALVRHGNRHGYPAGACGRLPAKLEVTQGRKLGRAGARGLV
jgi:hypothetical protein